MVKSDAVAGVERGEQEETLLIEAIVNSYEKKQYDTVLENGM